MADSCPSDQHHLQTTDAQGMHQAPARRTRALLQPSQTSEEKLLFSSEITTPRPCQRGSEDQHRVEMQREMT